MALMAEGDAWKARAEEKNSGPTERADGMETGLIIVKMNLK